LLTGEESYLAPYREGLSEIQKELEELRQLAATGDLPKNEVEHLTQLTGQMLDELNQTVHLRRDQGLEAALTIVRSNRGKEIMDQIRDQTARWRPARTPGLRQPTALLTRRRVFELQPLWLQGWRVCCSRLDVQKDFTRDWKSRSCGSGDQPTKGIIFKDADQHRRRGDRNGQRGARHIHEPVAEKLTGWNQQEAFGVPLERSLRS